ncbi:hypothetical protein ACSSS7_003206 [Eimeria intestinalis]
MADSLFAEGPNKSGAEVAEAMVLFSLMLQQMCTSTGVPFAGRIPLDKELLGACEGGYSLIEAKPKSVSATALRRLREYVVRCTDMSLPNEDTQQQQQQQQQQNGMQ